RGVERDCPGAHPEEGASLRYAVGSSRRVIRCPIWLLPALMSRRLSTRYGYGRAPSRSLTPVSPFALVKTSRVTVAPAAVVRATPSEASAAAESIVTPGTTWYSS